MLSVRDPINENSVLCPPGNMALALDSVCPAARLPSDKSGPLGSRARDLRTSDELWGVDVSTNKPGKIAKIDPTGQIVITPNGNETYT
jgi:hypothetical protein